MIRPLGIGLRQDPIRFAGGDASLYRYADGDPINLSDRTGLVTCVETGRSTTCYDEPPTPLTPLTPVHDQSRNPRTMTTYYDFFESPVDFFYAGSSRGQRGLAGYAEGMGYFGGVLGTILAARVRRPRIWRARLCEGENCSVNFKMPGSPGGGGNRRWRRWSGGGGGNGGGDRWERRKWWRWERRPGSVVAVEVGVEMVTVRG